MVWWVIIRKGFALTSSVRTDGTPKVVLLPGIVSLCGSVPQCGHTCPRHQVVIPVRVTSLLDSTGVTKKNKTVIYLDEAERDALKRLSAKTGASVSEIVRRCIAAYLKKEGKEA